MRDVYDLGDNEPVGFVVIEYNQASHQPDVSSPTIHRQCDRSSLNDPSSKRRKTAEIGRRERYAIAAVVELDGDW
jgi:hypothetical protein